MHPTIHQREREGITILDLKGKIVLGAGDSTFREHVQSLFNEGTRKVILNLKDVTDLDSAGLGTLVLLATTFRDAGGKLALLNMSPAHAQLPEVLKLNTVFEIYHDELDAVNSFFPERKVAHYDILQFVHEIEHDKEGEPKA